MARSMDFGEALFAMNAGSKVRQEKWVGDFTHMELDAKEGRFLIFSPSGLRTIVAINTSMVLAEDWQEVE